MWKPVLIAVTLASPVWSQDWKLRDGDRLFDVATLEARLVGQVLNFYDGGRSSYHADGSYLWTYSGGGDWHGTWRVVENSVVCVDYVTEVTRCDRIVENAGQLVLLTAEGERFPVRP